MCSNDYANPIYLSRFSSSLRKVGVREPKSRVLLGADSDPARYPPPLPLWIDGDGDGDGDAGSPPLASFLRSAGP